jgi:hypothetical protein
MPNKNRIVILFFLLCVLLRSAAAQGFRELSSTDEAELKDIIRASQEDRSRKKTFFAYIQLGSLYLKNNKIPECDSVLNILEGDFKEYITQGVRWKTMNVSDYYHLLSSLYYLKNDNFKSKLFLERAQELNPDLFSYSNNLYRIFVREGKLDSAELYLQKSFPVIAKDLDVNKLDEELLNSFDLTFRNMCQLKIMQGDLNGLEFYLAKWLGLSKAKVNNPKSIRKAKLDKLHAWQILYLSKYCVLTSKPDFSEKFLALSKPTSLSEKDYQVEYLRSWAQHFYAANSTDSTIHVMKKVLDFHKENVKLYFPLFTEADRENYINEINGDYEFFLSVISENPDLNKQHLTDLFEFQLFRKGLLLDITKNLNKVTATLYDKGANRLIQRISSAKDSIAYITFTKGATSSPEEKYHLLQNLNRKKEYYEKALLRLVQKESAILFSDHKVTDITGRLPEETCLVEVIRFKKWVRDPKRIISSKEIAYAAMLISQAEAPQIILIPGGDLLEGRYAKLYKNVMTLQIQDTVLHPAYWSGISKLVKPFKKTFLSPDGIYNVINLNTLRNPRTDQFVLDETQLINLTSSKDLLEEFDRNKINNSALLLGYPEFAYQAAETGGGDHTVRGEIIQSLESLSMQEFDPLPGTLTEIRQIDKLIQQRNGSTIMLEGRNATEAQLKSKQIPDILHLATHGFFISSENNFINPLLKSGLVLAGVNKKGYQDNTDEDGVLTAFEIASLDLKNTKLVVLSACETGLGEVKNGDGVYGLQRAFKIAEAKYIILSMWKVDDAATMQLMTIFYSNLLETNDVVQSFTIAQKELRKNYPSPYYWGAFKLIGY